MGRKQTEIVYQALHLFAGIGGGALGFQQASATIAGVRGRIETIVGIDVCPSACRDFEYLTKSPSACIDLFTAEQYLAFHSKWKRVDGEWVVTKQARLPDGWTEATPQTIRDACRGIAPDIVFLSPPVALLNAYGYAVQETVHNCGTIGGLAQSRKRFLLVARHVPTVAPFLYEPPSKPMRPLGDEVLRLPLPFDPKAGPMHRLSTKMELKTWLRLALIRPGKDWRDLQRWAPGTFAIERTPFNDVYRVRDVSQTAPAVTAGGTPTAGGLSVADPRLARDGYNRFVVQDTDAPARTVVGTADVQSGAHSVVDPRLTDRPNRHVSKYRIDAPDAPAHTVTGSRLGSGAISTADPRLPPSDARQSNAYRVSDPARPSGTVVTSPAVGSGAVATVDPRMSLPDTCVTLRVRGLDDPSPTVAASSSVWDSGGFSTVDPRPGGSYRNGTLGMGALDQPAATVIASADIWATGDNCAPDPRVAARWHNGSMGIADPAEPAGTVCGGSRPTSGTFSTVDPRPSAEWNGGVLGVAAGDLPSGAVCGRSTPTNGAFSVADLRDLAPLPHFWPADVPVLLSPHSGKMHRPLTELELALLQGFPPEVDGAPLKLDGSSSTKWRDKIGNAVPPPAARAIGVQMLKTLLGHDTQSPELGFGPVWVAPFEWYDPSALARLDAGCTQ